MSHRIEIVSKMPDARAKVKKSYIEKLGFKGKLDRVELIDVYTLEAALDAAQVKRVAEILSNPVTQVFKINSHHDIKNIDWVIEIGFLPGVTDNVGNTATESVRDLLKDNSEKIKVYNSYILLLSGKLTK